MWSWILAVYKSTSRNMKGLVTTFCGSTTSTNGSWSIVSRILVKLRLYLLFHPPCPCSTWFLYDLSSIAVRYKEARSGNMRPSCFRTFFSGMQNSFQGRVIKQTEAHPIGHNYVHLFDRQFHIFKLPFYQGHSVLQIVVLDNLGCVIKNVGHVDAVYMLGTCLCSKQRQKSQSTTHIQDNLVFE